MNLLYTLHFYLSYMQLSNHGDVEGISNAKKGCVLLRLLLLANIVSSPCPYNKPIAKIWDAVPLLTTSRNS